MNPEKLVGRNAASRKYDLIAAMGAHALAESPYRQKQVLRLLTLITARYNWRNEELTVGQREIARLWNVTERTVKREMANFRDLGWLTIKRAGVRGRVTTYSLSLVQIWTDTSGNWDNIGTDFSARMLEQTPQPSGKVVKVDFQSGQVAAQIPEGDWGRVCLALQSNNPAIYQNWYARLCFDDCRDGKLHLSATSPFVANYVEQHLTGPLLLAASAVFGPLADIKIRVGEQQRR